MGRGALNLCLIELIYKYNEGHPSLLTTFCPFQEEPGESLSDCDKDEEECQEECTKSDEESEDGFFVPDGYLSEDEVKA